MRYFTSKYDDADTWEDESPQCNQCGVPMIWADCNICEGRGTTEPGELHDSDPLLYDEDDVKTCYQCGGDGGDFICMHCEDPV